MYDCGRICFFDNSKVVQDGAPQREVIRDENNSRNKVQNRKFACGVHA
jgi:hypothetical protein